MLKCVFLTAVVACVLAVMFSPAQVAGQASKSNNTTSRNNTTSGNSTAGNATVTNNSTGKPFNVSFTLGNHTIIFQNNGTHLLTGVSDKRTKSVLNRSGHHNGGVQMIPQQSNNNWMSMMPMMMAMMGGGGGTAGRQDGAPSSNNNAALMAAMMSAMGQSNSGTQQVISTGGSHGSD